MNSDDEDRNDSPRSSSSLSDEESDTDIATVLTQLIRRLVIYPLMFIEWCVDQFNVRRNLPILDSGRAHILSERNSVFEERGESFHDFLSSARPPLFDKPDLTVLEVMNHLFTQ